MSLMKEGALFCVLWALVALCSANPFEPEYQLALDELRVDGDLALRRSLGRLRLDESSMLDICIDHNIEVGPYGHSRSVLTLRPLATSIAPLTDNKILWRKPGGGRLILGLQPAEASSIEMPSELKIRGLFLSKTEHSRFHCGAVYALVSNKADWVLVSDAGWWLYYEQGQLCAFQTPAGTLLSVVSEGGMIVSIRNDVEEIASFKKLGTYKYMLSANRKVYGVTMDGSGCLVNVESEHYRLIVKYGGDGLVLSVEECGIVHLYKWAITTQSMPAELDWVKPVNLRKVDDTSFSYVCRGATVTLTKKSPTVPEKLLRVRYRYGSIISVEEDMR